MQRGMHDVIKREEGDGGSLHDKVVKAFNVIAYSLTESGRLVEGSLRLTADKGLAREKAVKNSPDTREKQRQLVRWMDKLKDQYPTRYDGSWWTDAWRGVNPTQGPSP